MKCRGAWILDNGPHTGRQLIMAKSKTTPPKPAPVEKRQSTIYFPVDVLKRCKKFGIDQDRELSEIVTTAVVEYLDRVKAP